MSDETEVQMGFREPFDRLTRIVNDVVQAFTGHPEYEGERLIVMTKVADGGPGGVVFHGYNDSREMLVDLLLEVGHVLRAHGVEVDLLDVLKGDARYG